MSKKPLLDTKQRASDIQMDTIWENERGSVLFSSAQFTKKGLLPTDSSPFSDLKGSFCVDIRYFQSPPGWIWVSDWMLDLNGNVDEQGWTYSHSFKSDHWESSFERMKVSVVRRRKWTRLRRMIGTTTPKKPLLEQQELQIGQSKLFSICAEIQRQKIDRDRLLVVKRHQDLLLLNGTLKGILDEFEYDYSKLEACLVFKTQIINDTELLGTSLDSLKYYSDKKYLLSELGLRYPRLEST